MNEHETDRIAASIHQLRPDWPIASIRTLIRKHLPDRPRRDVAVALAWIASDPDSKTPARVLEAGPWWKAASADGQTVTVNPYDPTSFCHECGKSESACRRNELSDHDFLSATDYQRRLSNEPPKPPLRELVDHQPTTGGSQ